MREAKNKIKDLTILKEIIEKEKTKSKKIVLANGCFDLLHVGHIRYLQEAKQKGDILVVAINSDKSVKQLKGQNRPLIPENERAEIVAALEAVDYVFIFDDLRLDNILLFLKPDVQAKGRDYTQESVPERETVLSYGGKIAICGDPKNHSSTDLLKKLKT